MRNRLYLCTINEKELRRVWKLFSRCFKNDWYYKCCVSNFKSIKKAVLECLKEHLSFGVYVNRKLIGVLLAIDYRKIKSDIERYKTVLVIDSIDEIPYPKLWEKLESISGKIIYIPAIFVHKKYRRQGLASAMLDSTILKQQMQCYYYDEKITITSDVSNPLTLPMYERRKFDVINMSDNYSLVLREL